MPRNSNTATAKGCPSEEKPDKNTTAKKTVELKKDLTRISSRSPDDLTSTKLFENTDSIESSSLPIKQKVTAPKSAPIRIAPAKNARTPLLYMPVPLFIIHHSFE